MAANSLSSVVAMADDSIHYCGAYCLESELRAKIINFWFAAIKGKCTSHSVHAPGDTDT